MNITYLLLITLLSVLPLSAQATDDLGEQVQTAQQVTARDLVRRLQDRLRSDSSMTRYNMRIETADWQREVEMDAWDDRAKKRFFIRILAPKKDKNTTWLKSGGNLWMYLPKLERDIRIPPSMMLSNWMGSDFTNDDLVKMESVVEDYTHRVLSEQDGVYAVESIPRPDAPVVWGKIVRLIRHDAMPLSEDYFDEHGAHIRHLAFDRIQMMGGREIPTRWIMQADDSPDKRTIMILEKVTFDAVIEENIFTRRNMRH
ncbi:MAG: outer membrane lipoprotein-sorting protein [Mariprofundus sp.]|nr:outer membrane lipoprotein-sorting protein [Mariprofundus sp.]